MASPCSTCPFTEGPHRLPSVDSLAWRKGGWDCHRLHGLDGSMLALRPSNRPKFRDCVGAQILLSSPATPPTP